MNWIKKLYEYLTVKNVNVYVDPHIIGGKNDGTSWENAYRSFELMQQNTNLDLISQNIKMTVNLADPYTHGKITGWIVDKTRYLYIK